MIGQKINKPVQDWPIYTRAVLWYNANSAVIEDRSGCYEIVSFSKAPKPTLDEARAAEFSEINKTCDSIPNEVVSTYPRTEILIFSQQTAEAKAYQAGGNAEDTPLLSALAVEIVVPC